MPSDAFSRWWPAASLCLVSCFAFNFISKSYWLFLENTKLFDPCERGEIDIFSNIGRQQRENMMCSAQTAVRLIAFDQIHSLLGIDRLPVINIHRAVAVNFQVLNRKRPNNEDDDENGKPD